MSNLNPLQKYFRQPKIYISLPSKGLYYEPGALIGDYTNVPIFAMSGMDEIIFKTPDALFTGEATASVIESCCPYIKNANLMPGIDIDAILIAIRIATYGESLSVESSCPACGAENDYDITLTALLDYFNNLKYTNLINITDELSIKIRPLQYAEMNYFSIENFKLQKTLSQISEIADEEQQKQIDKIYKDLSELQLQLFLTSIEEVHITDQIVTNKANIEEWLRHTERESYVKIKTKLEENKEIWAMPTQSVQCASCNATNKINVVLDQSTFFA